MRVVWAFPAAAAAAVVMLWAAIPGAGAAAAGSSSFLFFSGTDLWRDDLFLYGGLLWAPAGLDADGFTFKLLLNGGNYSYPSGGLQMNVDGTMLSAAAMPGWRVSGDGLFVAVFAGPAVQDYQLRPDDPGSRLRGFYVGAEAAADVWYQPNFNTMLALNGLIISVGPTESLRGAVGWRLFEQFFVGPEAQGIWCADYQQLRLGVHVTALHIEALEWSAAGGWASDSLGRVGFYLRVGFNTRY